jgi:hypothetical protein
VQIDFHSNENIEWDCTQLELNSNLILKWGYESMQNVLNFFHDYDVDLFFLKDNFERNFLILFYLRIH